MNDQVIPPRPNVVTPTSSGAAPGTPETPTQEVVKTSPKKIVTVSDERNRVLTVKFLSPLDRMRLAKVVGADAAKNEVYLGYAALAFAVVKIDDEDVTATTARELEFLVERLGDEGLEAVGGCYQTHFASFIKGADADAAKN